MRKTLVVLAAGLGQRFGGVKQVVKVGPNGEILVDYAVYNAKQAGFEKVVFVIKTDIDQVFRDAIGKRLSKKIDIAYTYQDQAYLPDFYTLPKDRVKMLGTVQATLCAEAEVEGPFAIINADDYYGINAFHLISDYLSKPNDPNTTACMVGYILKNTIPKTGSVTRGVCNVAHNILTAVKETYDIRHAKDGTIRSYDKNPEGDILSPESIVSMNFWGFYPEIFSNIKTYFDAFLASLPENELKKEYALPTMVDDMIKDQKLNVHMLTSNDTWFGITNQEDRDVVRQELKGLHRNGIYPNSIL